MNIGAKVVITEGPHSGKRGRIASARNPTEGYPYSYYVKLYGSVIRYFWFKEHEVRADPGVSDLASKDDSVNHPSHYQMGNGAEVIRLTEELNFCRGNVVKYVCRAGKKQEASELEDLRKALWYLNREISRMENTK